MSFCVLVYVYMQSFSVPARICFNGNRTRKHPLDMQQQCDRDVFDRRSADVSVKMCHDDCHELLWRCLAAKGEGADALQPTVPAGAIVYERRQLIAIFVAHCHVVDSHYHVSFVLPATKQQLGKFAIYIVNLRHSEHVLLTCPRHRDLPMVYAHASL
jgi:hypothetical protein